MELFLIPIVAFLGVFLGTRLLKKITIGFIQKLVAATLYLQRHASSGHTKISFLRPARATGRP